MANPLRDFLFGTMQQPKRELVEAFEARRSFHDVILPDSTRQALRHALNQIRKRELIFGKWGLGERHATGQGLAFNFAGPPGTGKTICAEAIAHELGKKLLVVRYAEMESLWAGETGKNVAAVFHSAAEQDAVLFFDEADAIAGKRFANVTQGYQREANTVVNVLLKELEAFDGVVIFATNLAANFDPAFERRVRTHILFEMPGPSERAKIWRVQLHEAKTPLAPDVDFEVLGEKYAVPGGDIKNAVLKAAQIAAGESGPDADKKLTQAHFIAGMEDVLSSKKVMEQSIFADGDGSHRSSDTHALSALNGLSGAWDELAQGQSNLEIQLDELVQRVGESEMQTRALPALIERFDDAAREAQHSLRDDVNGRLQVLAEATQSERDAIEVLQDTLQVLAESSNQEKAAWRHELGDLQKTLEAETQSRALVLREHSENVAIQARALGELQSTLPQQINDGLARLEKQHESALQEQIAPLQTQLQVLAGRVLWSLGAAVLALIVAIVAIVLH